MDSENGNYVKCLLCDALLQYINAAHLKMHDYTTLDYMLDFPGEPLQSREMIEDCRLAREDYTAPQHVIDQRAKALRRWWASPEGLERREEMSRDPIVLRGK